MNRRLLVLVLALLAGPLLAEGSPPARWTEAGRGFPVAAEGRILPLDTWAPVVYFRVSGEDRSPQALGWLMTLLVFPEQLEDQPSILVNDPSVLAGTGVEVPKRGLYSPRDLEPLFALGPSWAARYADAADAPGRELARLGRALVLYQSLAATFSPQETDAGTSPLLCINLGSGALNPGQALASPVLPPDEKDRLGLLLFWRDRSRTGAWDEAAEALKLFSGTAAAGELFYNRVPWEWMVLGLGFLGLVLARGFPGKKTSGWLPWVSVVGWALVTLWLGMKTILSGHPPVTNLASTFLLVSWGCWGAGWFLAGRTGQHRTGLLLLATGAVLPLLAQAFQSGSDPFTPVQAVLNTNFWLGIHVTVVVLGYTGTLAAAVLGHGYLWAAGRRRPGGDLSALWKALQVSLGAGLALTLAGTILGGFWADQSWGRFWGWDPKENGALLVILWVALTMHLKPAGLTGEWGTALASALALPVLLFSWLGVNLLAQGFHSYGFAPEKALVFFGLLAADSILLALFTLRRVLR